MYLEKADIQTKKFIQAEDALKCLMEGDDPDLILLDLNLPGMSGFEFLETLKKHEEIPHQNVSILSAREADEDIINGLGYGANEFITKPFSPSVLLARIQANLRRNEYSAKIEDSISFGEYTMLLHSCVVKKGTEKVPLSTKEYKVLEYLIKHAGETLSPETIYRNVWKVEYGDITAVAVYIQRLRKKLEGNTENSDYIKTEFGKGYIFNKNVLK